MTKAGDLSPAERVIVALDVPGIGEAESLVGKLVPLGIVRYKIGLSLFTQAGPAAVEAVRKAGGEVFLDLKFHDIPSTVARSVRAAVGLGVWMVNLHIQGGTAMMQEAASAVREEAKAAGRQKPILIGVTVLTSLAGKDLADLGMRKTLKDQALYLARLARKAGLDGVVASAREARAIRWSCGEDFVIVTPGIRPAPADPFASGPASPKGAGSGKTDDQSRTATPAQAIKAGADYLVIGRPILQAPDPAVTAQAILRECGEGR